MADMIQLTNRQVADKYSHLSNLAAATLPDSQSENLIAYYISVLEIPIKARQKRMKPLEERRQRYAALSPDERAEKLTEWLKLTNEIEAVWDEVVEVRAPKKKLTDDNFPKLLKKNAGLGQQPDGTTFVLDGAANARGNSAAKAALSPEYYTLVEVDTDAEEKDED